MDTTTWARCSGCKGDIDFEEPYYACSVSTCNRRGTEFRFCSVECWDAHVPVMRHREAWAEDRHAPTRVDWERENPPKPPPSPEEIRAAAERGPSGEGGEIELAEEGVPRDVL